MSYNFNTIEAKWQKTWAEQQTFAAENNSGKPKYYVLDMFPYPSGAGLHVGHPLGYIASDIVARYKRHKGFNVLHPQGYDSFGLPAEQYAIQTGQHPAVTTRNNIKRYREQLDQIGFSFDWSREVRTSDPDYYKWTQWIFIQLFESWYDYSQDKARPISDLVDLFSSEGNTKVDAACDAETQEFSKEKWNSFSEAEKDAVLLNYRLTYLAKTEVNWCPELGTVLANDEIVNGVSERGGHPVERKKMKQWSMRISAYAERLLQGLDKLDWTESLKELQKNWIGKSVGSTVKFPILSLPVRQAGFPEGETKAEPELRSETGDRPGYMTGGNNAHLLNENAKEHRKNPTKAEKVLWEQLRAKKLDGFKFRQQHLIDDFIVDFVCLRQKLVIEVDGGIHETTKEYDEERTKIINKKGFKVIRFKNEEVIGDIDSVLKKISKELESQVPPSGVRGKVPPSGVRGKVPPSGVRGISVFTTRPDTIFGVTFMTLAPEHEMVREITTPEQKEEVEAYVAKSAKRSERERMAEVKKITGAFTGAYAEHPFTKEAIPIWIGDYVLAGYGTGAVMSVPCGDQRDYDFAKHFNIPIKNIFENTDISEEAFAGKEGTVIKDSDFLNGLPYKKALKKSIEELEKISAGKAQTNYRLRDAVFSRQRYWGEPFPVYYKNGMPKMIEAEHLPLKLPEVEKYLPTREGEPPLGRATKWHWDEKNKKVVAISENEKPPLGVWGIELNTMPGWAGSSWYFFRYMEPARPAGGKGQRGETFASTEAMDYWKDVDLYIGGSEHATGHLLYARFWTKFLKDRGLAPVEEPFKKLINQGMILGDSAFVYRCTLEFKEKTYLNGKMVIDEGNVHKADKQLFIPEKIIKIVTGYSEDFKMGYQNFDRYVIPPNEEKLSSELAFMFLSKKQFQNLDRDERMSLEAVPIRIPIEYLNNLNEVDTKRLKKEVKSFENAEFYRYNNEIIASREVEKMSKSKYNVVNPDDICAEFGADTLRMYEMFLGPLDQAKPWSTAGITGVHNFLKKLWKLYHSPSNFPEGEEQFSATDEKASAESLKTLHQTIKKVTEDIEDFSFNTSVSTFMICVNELTFQKCSSKEILEPLAVLISPYAPHIAEELWEKLGHPESISTAEFPIFEQKFIKESTKEYPISFNGKKRFTLELSVDLSKDEIEKIVMEDERTKERLEGKSPKKVIVVPGRIVNIVV
jgi:leucyl-tRNA synthetase